MSLALGVVTLDGFEITDGVRFGGNQALAVHKLPGGVRVVDAIGPDDADLTWTGVFSGADAAARARALDVLRAAGAPLSLVWDAFAYTVVIRRLTLRYANPWWIPYSIACTAVSDSAIAPVAVSVQGTSAILGDLLTAATYTDVAAAQNAVNAYGALTTGTAAYASAGLALGAVAGGISTQIATAEAGITGTDLESVTGAAGALATLCAARAYLARATINFENLTD